MSFVNQLVSTVAVLEILYSPLRSFRVNPLILIMDSIISRLLESQILLLPILSHSSYKDATPLLFIFLVR